MVLKKGTTGYYITNSTSQAERAMYFCIRCHRDVEDPNQIKKCKCPGEVDDYIISRKLLIHVNEDQIAEKQALPLNALMAAQMARKGR